MKNIIVRSKQNVFKPETKLLVERYDFEEINDGVTSKGLKSPKELAIMFLQDCLFVFRNAGKLRRTNTIIAVGYTAIPVKLLLKLRLIRSRQMLWFGFFLHSPKAFRIFRIIFRLLRIKNEKLVLNSAYEIPLYAEKLHIAPHKLTYMLLGDWQEVKLLDETYVPEVDEGYYFAGGYTNRDYTGVIEAFKQIEQKIIIVGSYLNKELNDRDDLPDNIIIKKDIQKQEFESLLAKAKACILPLKEDTGASGHMVLLGYMRNQKCTIASNMPAMREYLTHEQSGLLFDDARRDLPAMIAAIESGQYDIEKIGQTAYETYQTQFTYPALSQRLIEVIEEETPISGITSGSSGGAMHRAATTATGQTTTQQATAS